MGTNRKKILCIIGTRPQLIKHSVLLKQLNVSFEVVTVNTAQHYEHHLNGQLLAELFGTGEVHSLAGTPDQHTAERLGTMITNLATIAEQTKPDAVVIYGDTDTTLAGALAAKKCGLRLIHIEAGERSFNREMPEEQNRLVADALSDVLFCASENALANLEKENNKGHIVYSGDLMKDLLLKTAAKFKEPVINTPYFFCTLHRNYNQRNREKITGLLQVLQKLEAQVYFSLHPATAGTIKEIGTTYPNIHFLQPLDYSGSIRFQKFATAVITDSGGMQKEAYWLKRPCITVRKETEWVETLDGNWNQLVYEHLERIPELLQVEKWGYRPDLYGEGRAAEIICSSLQSLM